MPNGSFTKLEHFAISSLVEGNKTDALSIMRDLVHAKISFKTLAEQTGFDEKALHRMLSVNGNPTMRNLSLLIHTIKDDLKLLLKVTTQQTETIKSAYPIEKNRLLPIIK